MKIGFFTDRYYPQVDGVAVSVELYRKALEKLGHQVYIFAPEGKRKIKPESDRIIRFKSFPSIWYEDYRDTLPWTPTNINRVKACDLDIIHIHTPAQIGLLGIRIAKEDNIPLVTTYHTDIEQYITTYKRLVAGFVAGILLAPAIVNDTTLLKSTIKAFKPERPYSHWNKKIVRDTLTIFHNNCDLVIAPSKKMHDLLIKYHTTSPIETLPTGLDFDDTNLKPAFNPRIRYKIGSYPLLLFVGRLGGEKNIDLAINALPNVLDKHPNTKLILVGDGPHKAELKSLVQAQNLSKYVIFAGVQSRSNTMAFFRSADIFVFPSTTDTQGLVVNEAYGAKLPTVFCDEQISSLLQDNKTGLLANNEALDFANKILYLIDHPNKAKSFGQAGFELAKELDINKQAKKLIVMYEKVIAKKDHIA